jgi:hypothetical protein
LAEAPIAIRSGDVLLTTADAKITQDPKLGDRDGPTVDTPSYAIPTFTGLNVGTSYDVEIGYGTNLASVYVNSYYPYDDGDFTTADLRLTASSYYYGSPANIDLSLNSGSSSSGAPIDWSNSSISIKVERHERDSGVNTWSSWTEITTIIPPSSSPTAIFTAQRFRYYYDDDLYTNGSNPQTYTDILAAPYTGKDYQYRVTVTASTGEFGQSYTSLSEIVSK